MTKKLLMIILFLMLFSSCSAGGVRIWCRHKAWMQAAAYGEYYPTRIVVGEMSGGALHAQGQALIKGEWEWLQDDGEFVWVGESELININTPGSIVKGIWEIEDYENFLFAERIRLRSKYH